MIIIIRIILTDYDIQHWESPSLSRYTILEKVDFCESERIQPFREINLELWDFWAINTMEFHMPIDWWRSIHYNELKNKSNRTRLARRRK